jgi:hypothetical protein
MGRELKEPSAGGGGEGVGAAVFIVSSSVVVTVVVEGLGVTVTDSFVVTLGILWGGRCCFI